MHALLPMLQSIQQYVLLKIHYLEQYLYMKVDTPIVHGVENSGKEMQLFRVGHLEQDMRLNRAIRSEVQLSGVPYSQHRHYPEPGFVKNLTPVGTHAPTVYRRCSTLNIRTIQNWLRIKSYCDWNTTLLTRPLS